MDIGKIVIDHIDSNVKGSKNNIQIQQHDSVAVKNEKDLSISEIQNMVDVMNETMTNENNDRVSFSYNETTDSIVVKILNEDNEVVREIPAKDSVKLLEKIKEHLGVLFDESR